MHYQPTPKVIVVKMLMFFFSSRRRHTIFKCDWSSDVCSSDLLLSRGPLNKFFDLFNRMFERFTGIYVRLCGGFVRKGALALVGSGEGCVGEERRFRWSPYHLKKKIIR